MSDSEILDCVEENSDCEIQEEVSEPEDHESNRDELDFDPDEYESDTSENEYQPKVNNLLVARSGREYTLEVPPPQRRTRQNIIRGLPGLRNPAKNVSSIYDSFCLFMNNDIISLIELHTNEEAARCNIQPISRTELLAFMGDLILMGANNDVSLDIKELWSKTLGRPAYIASMSRSRFYDLLKIIRFDDKNTRIARRETDKFAPLREVFEKINATFPNYITPSKDTVIDEMLSLFRGRCSFKVFMKEKPGKYGILIRILADSKFRYVYKMEVYAGKSKKLINENGPNQIVKRLVEPIKNSGRNVTTDRYYTSVELAEDLYKNYGLTMVGTLRSNRRHIPEELKTTKNREKYSSIFAFTKPNSNLPPVTLVSYITRDKPKKFALILLSTQHNDNNTSDGEKQKSDINLYYNATKGGVDTIDQMARQYTTKRSSQRWPLSVFYSLLDIICINAFSVFTLNHPEWNKTRRNRRRLFLRNLGKELINQNVEERAKHITGLQKHVVRSIESVLQCKLQTRIQHTSEKVVGGKGRCHTCITACRTKREKQNKLAKTTITCSVCKKYVCGKCSTKTNVCLKCESDSDLSSD